MGLSTRIDPHTENTISVNEQDEVKPEYLILKNAIYNMSYGKERRQVILSTLSSGLYLRVNGMHQIQVKDDPDLKYLIKKKKVELVTQHEYHARFKRTYIRAKVL